MLSRLLAINTDKGSDWSLFDFIIIRDILFEITDSTHLGTLYPKESSADEYTAPPSPPHPARGWGSTLL